MPRSIWTGAISFGLVTVPIQLVSAVRRQDVHFHQLHAEDGARIQHRRFCSVEEREVPREEVVSAAEPERPQPAPDLMAALEARLAGGPGGGGKHGRRSDDGEGGGRTADGRSSRTRA
ncbi:MAG: hypothetical protein H0U12_11255 [Thermoleophilaceae bacterium]|nr:hypothetical protein [Thermoleophilaceae bacterium]